MLKRAGTVPVAVAVVLATQSGAHADTPDDSSFLSQIECGTNGGSGCDIQLSWEQRQGGDSGGGGEPEAPSPPPTQWDAIDWDAVDWDAVDWDAVDWDAIDWDAVDYSGGDAEEEVPEDPETLIAESMDSFELPEPAIISSPSPESLVLVTTPVWLWIDEEAWEPATAEADVPGLALELTATPGSTRWDMGDGNEVTCDGPGTVYDPEKHAPDSASPDCGHVYSSSSQGETDGTYTVTADIAWDITWELTIEESGDDGEGDDNEGDEGDEDGENGEGDEAGDDESGDDGSQGGGSTTETGQLDTVVTSSEAEIEVRESQGLVTGGGE